MAIVWLIEHPQAESIASDLMGNFAVRVFASLKSMQRLARFSRDAKPSVIVINQSQFTQSMNAVKTAISDQFPDSKQLVVKKEESTLAHLIEQVRNLISKESKATETSLKYKDIELKIDQFELGCGGGQAAESLTKKEALILKLLLSKAGLCVSRQEIKTAVWNQLAVTERTIDSHISRLRKRLNGSTVSIESIYGDGYTLL